MENIDKWIKAGRIAAEALQYGSELIKPGAKLLDVSEKIEEKIHFLGGVCAFPVQISMDHIAAHYCAEPNDETVFDKQVCCLDVGVHIDGCIGDTACTVDLSGENAELVKASREALDNVSKIIRVGITLGEIGKTIQETIEGYGFQPIRNLSGHGLSPYNIHDKPSIPNIDTKDKTELMRDQVIAIEPFATTGAGVIYETEQANIFQLISTKPVRSQISRQILKEIEGYKGLPFTTRWLAKKYPLFKVNFALKELASLEIIRRYPPLPDVRKGLVSQAEHTFIIDEKVIVTTKVND
ncbi:MAG: type II methionyl aminopeptidase [Candidatus Woesearchaeota archaeon]